jgi:phosphatidylserine/phosphatidylglycerophosphate/cardiolipin synthase-like enzyme
MKKRKGNKAVIAVIIILCLVLLEFCYYNKTSVLQTLSNAFSTASVKLQQPGADSNSKAAVQLSSGGTVQYYFPRAGQQPKPILIGIINSAKSKLDIAIYSFTDTDIANAIVNAKKRGLTVRLITDQTEAQNSYQKSVLNMLKNAGIPIKINSHAGLMHMKVTIADNSTVTTGSFNYTKAAETENDEVFVVINNAKTAQDFDNEFSQMWNDYNNYVLW